MADNVLEPYTSSFGDANPASNGCSSRVWVFPTSILQRKRSRCIYNDSLMNDAVYKFKRYEDASLSYTGIDCHEGEDRGGWDTVLSDANYNKMFTLQQASMEAPAPSPDDLPAKPYFTPDEDEPKPTRRKAHRLPAAKSTSRATAIHPARWVRVLALELQSRALVLTASRSAKTACQGGCFQNQGWCQGQA